MRRTPWAGFVALLVLFAAPAFAADDKVEVKVMKYDDLKDLVRKNKGKVVVVDFWEDFCTVCKKEMPRLIDLKKKYGDDLVAITVNLDDAGDSNFRSKNQKTLQKLQAVNTINVLLDEREGVGEKRLHITTFPTVFVFRPDGKYEKRYPEDKEKFDYDDVAAVVAGLLKKK